MWFQDDISLSNHRQVDPFQFGTTGRKKLKYPNFIEEKHWKALEKGGINEGVNTSGDK